MLVLPHMQLLQKVQAWQLEAAELSKRVKIRRQQCSTHELPQEFDKTCSFEHGNVVSRATSEFPIHGNESTQFSTEQGQEYGVHDVKHFPAESNSHVHPKLPEYHCSFQTP